MKLKTYLQQNRNSIDNQQMSQHADIVFEKLLKEKLHAPEKRSLLYFKYIAIAASIVFIFTLFLWNQTSLSDKDKRELLASLTDNSAGVRLEGVYRFNDEYAIEDQNIIKTLLTILQEDNNVNVKIATIDALLKFPSNEKIRISLVDALKNEQQPLVQIKLIKSLSFLRENRAQKPLEKLINNKQTFPIVKSNANMAIAQLKQ